MAPHLWQTEKAVPHHPLDLTQQQAGGGGGGAPCCPESPAVETHRLREYLPLLAAHDDDAHPGPDRCVACRDGVPVGPAPVELSSLAGGDGGRAADTTTSQASGGGSVFPGDAQVTSAAVPSPPVTPTTHVEEPDAPPADLHATPATMTATSHGTPFLIPNPPPAARGIEARPVRWLLALAVSGLLVQLVLRPLRRAVTLRHLRESMWAEPVDQRVSNLWQLVLVGLRDAGWHTAPGEQPHELARRVAVPGADACAQVLDRVRHGVRLDPLDLQTMKDAARTAYRTSHRSAGWTGRALSWLRWPLV